MNSLVTFGWGAFGSIAIEVINIYQSYEQHNKLPEKYKCLGYWIVRACVVVVSGVFAVSYEIDKPLLAINIGVATPLIIQAFGKVKPVTPALPTPGD